MECIKKEFVNCVIEVWKMSFIELYSNETPERGFSWVWSDVFPMLTFDSNLSKCWRERELLLLEFWLLFCFRNQCSLVTTTDYFIVLLLTVIVIDFSILSLFYISMMWNFNFIAFCIDCTFKPELKLELKPELSRKWLRFFSSMTLTD